MVPVKLFLLRSRYAKSGGRDSGRAPFREQLGAERKVNAVVSVKSVCQSLDVDS